MCCFIRTEHLRCKVLGLEWALEKLFTLVKPHAFWQNLVLVLIDIPIFYEQVCDLIQLKLVFRNLEV
jgi:hypothetical protein